MFATIYSQLGTVVLAATFAFALWKGDAAERLGAGINLAAGLLAMFLQHVLDPDIQPVALATGKGDSVATGPVSGDPSDKTALVVPITSPLSPGKYHVSWSVVSADMHKVAGAFDFEVKQ